MNSNRPTGFAAQPSPCADHHHDLVESKPRFLQALISALAAVAIVGAAIAGVASESTNALPPLPQWDTFSDTWVAADSLGRTLPTFEQTGPMRQGKTVGIFYFLWQTSVNGRTYDLSRILAENPAAPRFGPPGAFHWWGEPWFGHYRTDDEFVIRKHAQMLTDAGVDVLIFDVTNGFTYDETYQAICRVFASLRQQGQKTPQITFIAHSGSAQVVHGLSQRFYEPGSHRDLWFQWKGRPLFLTPFKGLSPAASNFFTLRYSWAWSDPRGWFGDGRDRWPWLDHTPQKPGWHESPDRPEQISVCAAEHPTSNIGRSFHNGRQPPPAQVAPERGLYFAEQIERALVVDPEFVFVTGWNEWIAQRFVSEKGGQPFLGKPLPPGGTFFVDQFNQEFSRDIEPMKGGHGDNYYYQLASFVRRYKGARPLPAVRRAPIRIDGQFADWTAVQPEFRDQRGDPVRRQHPGAGDSGPYVNATGRNDLLAAQVSWDDTHVYFHIRTARPLTAPTDPNWMLLFIDSDRNPTNGWLGYDFVLNRVSPGANTAKLERHAGPGYRWTEVTAVQRAAAGAELELAVPRLALGVDALPATLDFKWADNIQQTGEASDFTLNGDAAPNDRFNYRAKLATP